MKKAISGREAAYGPLQRKTFRAALVHELRLHVPALGSLTAIPLAQRIEQMVDAYYPAVQRLRMGQLMWPAVDERETSGYGKRIEDCQLKPVLLEAVSMQDIEDLLKGLSGKQIRQKVAVRLFEQAKSQGGVLTSVDAASIMRLSPSTIGRYIKEHEKLSGTLVPRRGTVHDMGPSLTRKRQICRMVIVENQSVEQTARRTNHSAEAVTRYVHDYRRVCACMKRGLTLDQTSFATSLSKRLITEYQDLMQEDNDLQEGLEDDILF